MKALLAYLTLFTITYYALRLSQHPPLPLSVPYLATYQALLIFNGHLQQTHPSLNLYQRLYLLSDQATSASQVPKPIRLFSLPEQMTGIIYTYEAFELAPTALREGFLNVGNLMRFENKVILLPIGEEECLGERQRRQNGAQACRIVANGALFIETARREAQRLQKQQINNENIPEVEDQTSELSTQNHQIVANEQESSNISYIPRQKKTQQQPGLQAVNSQTDEDNEPSKSFEIENQYSQAVSEVQVRVIPPTFTPQQIVVDQNRWAVPLANIQSSKPLPASQTLPSLTQPNSTQEIFQEEIKQPINGQLPAQPTTASQQVDFQFMEQNTLIGQDQGSERELDKQVETVNFQKQVVNHGKQIVNTQEQVELDKHNIEALSQNEYAIEQQQQVQKQQEGTKAQQQYVEEYKPSEAQEQAINQTEAEYLPVQTFDNIPTESQQIQAEETPKPQLPQELAIVQQPSEVEAIQPSQQQAIISQSIYQTEAVEQVQQSRTVQLHNTTQEKEQRIVNTQIPESQTQAQSLPPTNESNKILADEEKIVLQQQSSTTSEIIISEQQPMPFIQQFSSQKPTQEVTILQENTTMPSDEEILQPGSGISTITFGVNQTSPEKYKNNTQQLYNNQNVQQTENPENAVVTTQQLEMAQSQTQPFNNQQRVTEQANPKEQISQIGEQNEKNQSQQLLNQVKLIESEPAIKDQIKAENSAQITNTTVNQDSSHDNINHAYEQEVAIQNSVTLQTSLELEEHLQSINKRINQDYSSLNQEPTSKIWTIEVSEPQPTQPTDLVVQLPSNIDLNSEQASQPFTESNHNHNTVVIEPVNKQNQDNSQSKSRANEEQKQEPQGINQAQIQEIYQKQDKEMLSVPSQSINSGDSVEYVDRQVTNEAQPQAYDSAEYI